MNYVSPFFQSNRLTGTPPDHCPAEEETILCEFCAKRIPANDSHNVKVDDGQGKPVRVNICSTCFRSLNASDILDNGRE